ncbi:MAG: Hsp70 family protein [Pseudoclavibacter sp.]
MLSYALGINIGSCTLSAGVAKRPNGAPTQVEPLPLGDAPDASDAIGDPADRAKQRATAPAIAFVDDDARVVVGDTALRLSEDRPERAIRDVVHRVGDAVPITVGDLDIAAEDLYAAMVEWMLERAITATGSRPEAVALTHPSSWGAFRIELVRDAIAERGLEGIRFVAEPIAAAQHDAVTRQPGPGTAIAIYDLGGGSFDATVVRADDDGRLAVVGSPVGVPAIGGATFEYEVVSHVLAHATPGQDARGAESSDPEGSGAESSDEVADAAAVDVGRVVAALDAGASRAAGALRRACADAIATLSLETETSIPVITETGPTSVRLVRAEYEAMIEPRISETVDAMRRAIDASAVADLDAIVLVGGAAQTPIVAQQLSAAFGRPIAIGDEPQLAGAFGAAVLAAEIAAAEPGADEEPRELQVDDAVAESQHVASAARRTRRATFQSARRRRAAAWLQLKNGRGAVIGGAAAAALAAVLVTPAIAFALSVGGPSGDAGARAVAGSHAASAGAGGDAGSGEAESGEAAGEQAGGADAGGAGSGGPSDGAGSTSGAGSGGGSSSDASSGDASGSSNEASDGATTQPGMGGPHTDPTKPPGAGGSWNNSGSGGETPTSPTQQPPAPTQPPSGPSDPSPDDPPETQVPDPDPDTEPGSSQPEGDPAP